MFKGGMGNIMKQAQQMQERMEKAQEEIKSLEVTGEAGAGLVKVTMLGSHNVRRVEIDESLMEDDKDMIEDLLAAAVNDAVRRVGEETQKRMSEVTGGMQMLQASKCRSNLEFHKNSAIRRYFFVLNCGIPNRYQIKVSDIKF